MKAVIHIGLHKTGTTTIQHFLAKNRESLQKQGVYIPSSIRETRNKLAQHRELNAAIIPSISESGPLFSLTGQNAYNMILKQGFTRNDQDKIWEKYRHEIEENCQKDDLVLFSSEYLSNATDNEIERLKEWMSSLFEDIIIVLYLRRQPEFLVSIHHSFVGSGSPWSLLDLLNRPEGRSILAYHKIVERWSIFGKEKIKIRIFDRQKFHESDLLSDFAYTVGFEMAGLESVTDENVSTDSVETEFLRLLNSHIPPMPDSWPHNPARGPLKKCIYSLSETNSKAYHLTCGEAQHILNICREGNDWIAREYLGREKLFSEDVSMYPEEVASPHGLTLEKCAEITAHLWKERCQAIRNLQQKNEKLKSQRESDATKIKTLTAERDANIAEIQRIQTELQRLLHRRNKRLLYRFKSLLNWIKTRLKKNNDKK